MHWFQLPAGYAVFSFPFMTGNKEFGGFGLQVGQDKQFEDITLSSNTIVHNRLSNQSIN